MRINTWGVCSIFALSYNYLPPFPLQKEKQKGVSIPSARALSPFIPSCFSPSPPTCPRSHMYPCGHFPVHLFLQPLKIRLLFLHALKLISQLETLCSIIITIDLSGPISFSLEFLKVFVWTSLFRNLQLIISTLVTPKSVQLVQTCDRIAYCDTSPWCFPLSATPNGQCGP